MMIFIPLKMLLNDIIIYKYEEICYMCDKRYYEDHLDNHGFQILSI
jgi:hypothetical protein